MGKEKLLTFFLQYTRPYTGSSVWKSSGSAQDSYFTAEQAEGVKQAIGVREEQEEEERGVSTIYRGGTVFSHWRSPEIQSLEGSALSPGEFSSLKLKQCAVSS